MLFNCTNLNLQQKRPVISTLFMGRGRPKPPPWRSTFLFKRFWVRILIVTINFWVNSEVCHPRCGLKTKGKVNSVRKHNYNFTLDDGIY